MKIRVLVVVASRNGATLYQADGGERNLLASEWQTEQILKDIAARLKPGGHLDIDLDDYRIEKLVEKKGSGLLRFVREKVTAFFRRDDKNLPHALRSKEETTVAVIDGKKLPGVEAIEAHMHHAVTTDNVVGLENFLRRVANVAQHRQHTAQELLEFMRKGDLPIADDGSILAYKRLYRHEGRYVDPHTKSVSQTIGSYVSMPVEKVDQSRRVQCSNGLHIGRRGYMGGFNGNAITLVKIAPEDVVAVPLNEPDKMRVAGYHILAELDQTAFDLVCSNRPMTSHPPAARLLAEAIAGCHIGVTELVHINASGQLEITKLEGAKSVTPIAVQPKPQPTQTVDAVRNEAVIDIAAINKIKNNALDAAISAPEHEPEQEAKPEPVTVVVVKKPKVAKTKVEKSKPEPKPANTTGAPATDSPIDKALAAVRAGMSQREAVKIYKVCAKTIRRRLAKEA